MVRTLIALLCVVGACGSSKNDQQKTSAAQQPVKQNLTRPASSPDAALRVAPKRCSDATDCMVYQPGCCPACMDRVPQAVAKAEHARLQKLCATKKVMCAMCIAPGLDQNYIPTCQAGACELVDVRKSPMSACKVDQDCTLVLPSCCGCGGAWVAVSKSGQAQFRKAVCDAFGRDKRCAACTVPTHPGITAACVQDHCKKSKI